MLVDLDNVTLRRGAQSVLERVSLCIHQGEFVGIIGPNGAGKTTLLRILLGLEQPTRGTVRRSTARIGYIPQRTNIYNGIVPLSVLEVANLGASGDKQKALRALAETNIKALASQRFSELSGGQQQRVVIAKALAGNADLLVLDEPTTGIDTQTQTEFYNLLGALQSKGITIVMVSHEVEAVTKLVTRLVCLNRTILYDGPPEHFEADKYMPAAYQAKHLQLHHHHAGDSHA